MNRQRLEFATMGWLAEMRKQFLRLYPDRSCPIRNFEDYTPDERSVMMAALQRAIQYASADNDKLFETWLARKNTQS